MLNFLDKTLILLSLKFLLYGKLCNAQRTISIVMCWLRSPNDPSVLLSNSEIFAITEVDDNEFRPPEAELDEHHPKATRTLFVGNLEKDISNQELRERFLKFGEILVSIT